jgi:hypothetical protein
MPTVPVPENKSAESSPQALTVALDGVSRLRQLAALMADPMVGYASLPVSVAARGVDGVSLSDHYLSAFDTHRDDISAGMGQASRKLFDGPATAMRDELAKRLEQHEAGQRDAWQAHVRQDAEAKAATSAATDAADTADTTDEAYSPESFGRKVVEPVVDHQLSENRVSDARAFFDKYRYGMTPDAANALEARVADAEGSGQNAPVQVAAGYGFLPPGLRDGVSAKGFGGAMSDVESDADGYDWDLRIAHPDEAQQKALKIVADRVRNPLVRFDDKRGTLVDIDPLDPRKQTPMTKTRMQAFLEDVFNVPNATTETLPKAYWELVGKETPDYNPLAEPKKAIKPQKPPAERLGPGDEQLLARMIYAETSNIPEDSPAVGWTMVNRVGDRAFGATLTDVLRQKNAYQIVPEGGGPPGGSAQWQATEDPSRLTGANAAAWAAAQRAAAGIINGSIPDPTSGATFFFSASDFDGKAKNAPGDFKRMLGASGAPTLQPSIYKSQSKQRRSNYFFTKIENK